MNSSYFVDYSGFYCLFLFCFVFREKVVPLHSLSKRNMFLLTGSTDRSLK